MTSLRIATPLAQQVLRRAPAVQLRREALEVAGAALVESAATRRGRALEGIRRFLAAEAALPLQDGSRSQLLAHATPTGKGTVVLLHGWSSGTYQYDQLGPKLFGLGFDVFIPRLPGHGFKTAAGVADPSHLPRAGQRRQYRDYADEVMALVGGLGGPIHVAGLSGGGNIALDIRNRYPVTSVLAMAPYLAAADGRARGGHNVMAFFDTLTFGQASRLLDLVKHDWGTRKGGAAPGHWHHTVGNIYAVSRHGDRVISELRPDGPPIQFITTAVDRAASNDTIGRAFRRAGGDSVNGWYQFPVEEGVPHPMLSPVTNPKPESITRLNDVIAGFFDTGRAVDRGTAPTSR
ncbi:MAG: alpha/beta hydrolase [Candidatus Sericytochromatia bacterium]|nr:alpha/beta hydrolase [Candidatus Sericytochromatia bacterium]